MKNKFIIFFVYYLVNTLVCISSTYAQIIWSSNILINKSKNSYLITQYKNKENKLLYNSISDKIFLQKGINTIISDAIKIIKTEYFDKEIERSITLSGTLPEGTYEICISAYAVGTNEELGRVCHTETIVHTDAEKSMIKSSGLSSAIKPFGNASIDFFSTSPRQSYTELQASYLRVQADPGFSIYGIPIAGQFRYTTEKVGPYSELDLFTLKIDRSKWEQRVRAMIISRIAASRLSIAKEYEDIMALLADRDQLEARLKEKGTEYITKQIDRVRDSITGIKDKIIEASEEKLSDLQSQYKSLIAQKNQIDRMVDRYRQLDALKKKWTDTGKLDELKKLVSDPPDLSDPKILLAQLRGMGAFSGINKFLFNIKEISLGSSFPVYSPLTLNGTQILGGNLEWNPGLLTISVAGGKVQNAYLGLVDTNASRFSQQVAALRLGIGRQYGTYLSFNALHFWDKAGSLSPSQGYEIFPQSSSVGSMDFGFSLGKQRFFELGGEIAGIYKNQNTLDTKAPFEIPSEVPDQVSQFLKPNLSSNGDFAFNATSAINLFNKATRLSASAHYAGPGYFHPGTFGIQNDLFRQSFRYDQDLARNKIRLGAFYTSDYDNFSNAKGLRTYRSDIGGELSIQSSKALSANLRLSHQQLDNSVYTYQSNVANLTLNKSFKLSSTSQANTTISGMYFATKTDSVSTDIQSFYGFLMQSLSLRGGWLINLSGQYAINKTTAFNNLTSGINASIGKSFFKRIRLSGGVRYMDTQLANNFGYTLDINGDIAKNLSLNVRAFKNDYTKVNMGVVPGGETVVMSGLRWRW